MMLWLCMCTLTPYYHGSFLFTFRWRYVSRLGRLIVTSWQPVTRWLNRGYWRRLKVRGGGGGGGVHFQPGLLYQYQPSTSLHLAPLGSWKRQHYAVISNHGQQPSATTSSGKSVKQRVNIAGPHPDPDITWELVDTPGMLLCCLLHSPYQWHIHT